MDKIKRQLNFLASFHKITDEIYSTIEHKIEQFECPKTALTVFLRDFAFEKSGSAVAFKSMAINCIDSLENNFDIEKLNEDFIKKIWKKFEEQRVRNNLKGLNPMNNPLYPFCVEKKEIEKGNNKKKYKFVQNENRNEISIIDILKKYKINNIAKWSYESILNDRIDFAHKKLSEIRGVNHKVISLYLREIAYLKQIDVNGKNNIYLLQPIDTWMAQVYKIIFDNSIIKDDFDNKKDVRTDVQKKIIDECNKNKVSSIKFNKGAWYFGSHIAKDFPTLENILRNIESEGKIIINKYIDKLNQEKELLEKIKL